VQKVRLLVSRVWGLLLRAKHLFVAAIGRRSSHRAAPCPRRAAGCADGATPAHPELVVAIVHAASSDWAARVITAGLQDIALVEGGVVLPDTAGLVAARSIVRP
jgi:hypothetical protein